MLRLIFAGVMVVVFVAAVVVETLDARRRTREFEAAVARAIGGTK